MKVLSKKAEAKIGRSQLFYSYKLQIRADLKDTLNCAAILQNIIWSLLGTQFHLRYRFTYLFARILRQRIRCRNRMAWELSPWVYLPITTWLGSNEKRAKRGCRSVLERTRSRPGLIKLPLHELSCQWFLLSSHRYSEWIVSTSSTLETFVLRRYRVPFPANFPLDKIFDNWCKIEPRESQKCIDWLKKCYDDRHSTGWLRHYITNRRYAFFNFRNAEACDGFY